VRDAANPPWVIASIETEAKDIYIVLGCLVYVRDWDFGNGAGQVVGHAFQPTPDFEKSFGVLVK
jgi:hypothetical protein